MEAALAEVQELMRLGKWPKDPTPEDEAEGEELMKLHYAKQPLKAAE